MSSPDRINHNPAIVPPLGPGNQQPARVEPGRTQDGKSFEEILRSKVSTEVPVAPHDAATTDAPATTIRWSAHAEARLQQRGITLGEAELQRLERAVDKAAAKGAKESLVMMDDIAMVVSVRNRTVITALAQQQAKENVFTNIDSAVIA